MLWYFESEFQCKIAGGGQCYWSDLQTAKDECRRWDKCVYLYETDRFKPATKRKPIWWARARGINNYESGAVLWKLIASMKIYYITIS